MHEESIYNHFKPAVKAQQVDRSDAYWLVFSKTKMLLKAENNLISIPLAKAAEDLGIIPVREHYLGTLYGNHCYTVEVEEDICGLEGMFFKEFFMTYSDLPEDLFFLAGRASQILKWDREHRYCGHCGAPTELLDSERAKKCPVCGLINYPELKPAIITAILKDDKILLARAPRREHFSIIAGFVEPGETLEECLKREVREEVGVYVKNIRYFGSRTWPFPNSLMIGFITDYDKGEIAVDNVEIIEAGWFDLNNLPQVPSEVSLAKKIIDWCIKNYSA